MKAANDPFPNTSAGHAYKRGIMNAIQNPTQKADIHPEKRKILVLSADHQFRNELVTHAVHLAERMDYGIYAVNVNTEINQGSFRMASELSWLQLKAYAETLGIDCEHSIREGSFRDAIEAIRSEVRRIEMIVTDTEITEYLNGSDLSIPIVNVISTPRNGKGEKIMATHSPTSRSKHWMPAAVFGLATAALYTAVFMNADTVMSYFTRGSWYAAMPIATVFVVSYIHGSFSSHLWSLLGIEAMKKDALHKTEKAVVAKKQAVAKRPRAYAHINPFHNI